MNAKPHRRFPDHCQMRFGHLAIPDVWELKRLLRLKAEAALGEHTHPSDELEFLYLAQGRQTHVVAGRRYDMHGGEVLAIFPGETHSSGGAPQEKCLTYWLSFRLPEKDDSFLNLPPSMIVRIMPSLRHLGQRHFAASPRLRPCLDEILADMWWDQGNYLNPLRAQANLLLFLTEVIESAKRQIPTNRSLETRVLACMRQRLAEPLTVSTLAERLGMSTSGLNLQLKRETGLSPAEYLLRSKLVQAQDLLIHHPEKTVTDIALEVGCSSSQYFATLFKRYRGMTPRQVRSCRSKGLDW
jgi:AraC-like DNA-binding protein